MCQQTPSIPRIFDSSFSSLRYCTYKCDHIHKNWMKEEENKNRKNHISHFLKMNRLTLNEKKERLKGKFNENCFSTHDSSSSCIKHILRSLFTKKTALVSRSFQCTQKRKEHGKGEKFSDCGNEIPCGEFQFFLFNFQLQKNEKFITKFSTRLHPVLLT